MFSKTRVLLLLFLTCMAGAAFGQAAYPEKSVRLLVGFTPGGSTDIVARLISQKLSELWGQQMIVDNRPGAGANIAAELAAKSTPDGYTMILAQNSLAISPFLYPKLGYDAKKDLVAVGSVASSPHILVVHPSLAVKDVKQLIELAKSQPGKLTFASSGVGINDHMGGELFREMAKLNVVHVPYKGGAQSMGSIVSGETNFYFAGVLTALPLLKQGRLRALAVTSKERFEGAKEIPTVAESGLKDFELILWQGFFAPSGTDPKIIAKVSADVAKSLQNKAMVNRFGDLGLTPFISNPEEFKSFYDSEYRKWGEVVRNAGIKLE